MRCSLGCCGALGPDPVGTGQPGLVLGTGVPAAGPGVPLQPLPRAVGAGAQPWPTARRASPNQAPGVLPAPGRDVAGVWVMGGKLPAGKAQPRCCGVGSAPALPRGTRVPGLAPRSRGREEVAPGRSRGAGRVQEPSPAALCRPPPRTPAPDRDGKDNKWIKAKGPCEAASPSRQTAGGSSQDIHALIRHRQAPHLPRPPTRQG